MASEFAHVWVEFGPRRARGWVSGGGELGEFGARMCLSDRQFRGDEGRTRHATGANLTRMAPLARKKSRAGTL